ncbi:MAG TPA: protein kinase [Acidobacteriota bacterium]|nr:protein kinase [Acidobacteriota bacterium]
MSYEIGSRVGDYEILQILGAGGMGRVYKVRNVLSDRVEAMKVLLPDLEGNPGLADRFMREIKVQASLDHPNIAALHTALRIENQLMMLMEYVDGVTLDKMMEAGPVPIDKAVDYIAQVLSALAYAHARGVVHRDLKPANMMIMPNGVVKLMDFGIAKMTADRKLTQTGSTVGSLYYMSPEQIKGAVDLDPRSDLYSLGVSLYEVVTGARPFQGDSEYSIMAAHLQKNPPPPIEISPNLPNGLNEIILQALQKEPAKRFQTADAFRNALLYVCKQPLSAAPVAAAAVPPPKAVQPQPNIPPPPPPAVQPASSHRGLWITIGAVIVLAVIAVVAMQMPMFHKTAAETASAQPSTAVSGTATPLQESSATVQPPPTQASVPSTTSQEDVAAPAQVASAPEAQSPQTKPTTKPASAPSKTAKQMQSPLASQAVSGTQPPAPAKSGAAPATPVEDPATAEQLKEVKEQLNLLSIRMDTVKSSLDSLRKQQATSGFGLRADMASSAQRMEYYYSQTDAALKNRDAAAAKKNLDLTEREVTKLENFLGK